MSEYLEGTIKRLSTEAIRLEHLLLTKTTNNAENNIFTGYDKKYVINNEVMNELTTLKYDCFKKNNFTFFGYKLLFFYETYIEELHKLTKKYGVKQ